MTRLLAGKVAVVYGGGPISSAVCRSFAGEGAHVHLAGRNAGKLEQIASECREIGEPVRTETLDALDESAVGSFLDTVVAEHGRVDISFNLIGLDDVQMPLMEISVEDFLQPICKGTRSHFVTTKAAARHMKNRGSGVVLQFGGGGPQTLPGLGGFKVALDALESLRRQWAIELGEYGIRLVTIKTGGVPESVPDDFPHKEAIAQSIADGTLLKRAATLADVGEVSAFVASDRAKTLTSTAINISAGAIIDG